MHKLMISALLVSLMGTAAFAGQPEGKGEGKATAAEASTGAAGNGIVGHGGEEGAQSGQEFGEGAATLGKDGEMAGHVRGN